MTTICKNCGHGIVQIDSGRIINPYFWIHSGRINPHKKIMPCINPEPKLNVASKIYKQSEV